MMLRPGFVDNDQDIQDSLRDLFEDTKAFVEEATDGVAALALLPHQAAPRMVLLDHVMPRLDGVGGLHAQAQASDLQRRTAILFTTARHMAALTGFRPTLGGVTLP